MAMIGKRNFLKNLNREIGNIEGRTFKGMLAAAEYVKLKSKERTPVDKGPLRAGHYVSRGGSKRNPVVEIGTVAKYSVFVHENMENKHTVGEAKFLERAVHTNRSKILEIIRNRARIR